jgi:putative ABC transport system permease protein
MENLAGRLYQACRVLLHSPAYATVAILVLGLGVGAATTVYGVLQGVALKPLPYLDADRIVKLSESHLPDKPVFPVATGNFMEWQKLTRSFASMAVYFPRASYSRRGNTGPVRMAGAEVSSQFFEVLGVRPALGRVFVKGDDSGRDGLVVLSHRAWLGSFSGDAEIVGRALTLNGKPFTVVGVMPSRFDFPDSDTDAWTLWRTTAEDAASHIAHANGAIARLATGVDVDSAQRDLETAALNLEAQYPASNRGWRTGVQSLPDALLGSARTRLQLLCAGVGLVLLIAAFNVACLAMLRSAKRLPEFAVKRFLGARASNIALDLCAEGFLLALVGGALGILLAAFALPLVRVFAPADIPRIDQLELDASVLAFAIAMCVVIGMLATVLPMLLASRRALASDLQSSGRSNLGGGGAKARSLLVVFEIALATILLIGAGLLVRSILKLDRVRPGFDSDSVAAAFIQLPQERYVSDADINRYYEQLMARLADVPGIKSVGVASSLPLVRQLVGSFSLDGRPDPAPGAKPTADFYSVSPGYFSAMSIPVIQGRTFSGKIGANSPPEIVIGATFAARYFGKQNAMGQRIRVNWRDEWFEVVGVVGDVRQKGLDHEASAQMYVPFSQWPFAGSRLVAKTTGNPMSYAQVIGNAVQSIDPEQPVSRIQSLRSIVRDSVASDRFYGQLISAFALIALTLAAVGLYGVIAYSVAQSTRALGLRMAVGAKPCDLLLQVLGQSARLAGSGVALGVAIALALSSLLTRFLFGMTPYDLPVYSTVVLILGLVATLASLAPAWRATRIDPVEALRYA